jgi:agmatinase
MTMINTEGLELWAGLAKASTTVKSEITVMGIPYDGSAVYRKGASQAPGVIRELSKVFPPVLETGYQLRYIHIDDVGDLDPKDSYIDDFYSSIVLPVKNLKSNVRLLALGGDHTIAIGVLAGQYQRYGQDLGVLWIDAHPDLCDTSRGGSWTVGCALRRSMEITGLSPSQIAIVGTRDYDPEEVEFIRYNNIFEIPMILFDHQEASALGRVTAEQLSGKRIHISFDVDALDPSVAPGTEIPAAGGLSIRQVLSFIRGLAQAGGIIVGLDVVEYAPPLDVSYITGLAALKIIFEILGVFERQASAP